MRRALKNFLRHVPYNILQTYMYINNLERCLSRHPRSQRRGVEREKPLSLSCPIRERLCYADEKLLALLPDCIGSSAKLLKLLVVNKLLKRYVRLTFSKTER